MGDSEKEGLGEAQPGEAQSSDPAIDPEMIDTPSEGEEGRGTSGTPEDLTGGLGGEDEPAEGGAESYGGDQDAEAPDQA
jgi:hypothetical protein